MSVVTHIFDNAILSTPPKVGPLSLSFAFHSNLRHSLFYEKGRGPLIGDPRSFLRRPLLYAYVALKWITCPGSMNTKGHYPQAKNNCQNYMSQVLHSKVEWRDHLALPFLQPVLKSLYSLVQQYDCIL